MSSVINTNSEFWNQQSWNWMMLGCRTRLRISISWDSSMNSALVVLVSGGYLASVPCNFVALFAVDCFVDHLVGALAQHLVHLGEHRVL